MTIQVTKPEIEKLINQRLETGAYQDAEDVILRALQLSEADRTVGERDRLNAIEHLMSFGKEHRLSLGDKTIRELREEARP